MPTVSVLMSVHNGGELLKSSVQSILSQQYRDLELIVVDDGSSDGSFAYLADVSTKDARVRVLRNEENRGLTASLNRAFTISEGELIARQDADDISRPDRLAQQVAFLARHPEVGLLGSWYDVIDLEGTWIGLNAPPVDDLAIRWCMVFQNAFCHSSVVLRRAILEKDPWIYDPGVRYAQDFSAWSRLLDRTKGANIPAALVMYRVHEGNISARKTAEQQDIADRLARTNIRALLADVPDDYEFVRGLREIYAKGIGRGGRYGCTDIAMYFSLLRRFMKREKAGTAALARLFLRELTKLCRPGQVILTRSGRVMLLEALRTTWTVLKWA